MGGADSPRPTGGQRRRSRLTPLSIGFSGLRPLSRAGDSVCSRQASHPPAGLRAALRDSDTLRPSPAVLNRNLAFPAGAHAAFPAAPSQRGVVR